MFKKLKEGFKRKTRRDGLKEFHDAPPHASSSGTRDADPLTLAPTIPPETPKTKTITEGQKELRDPSPEASSSGTREPDAEFQTLAPTIPSEKRNAWEEAYQKLRADSDFSDRFAHYEEYLVQQASSGQDVNPGTDSPRQRFERLQIWTKRELDALPKRRMAISIGGREIVVRDKFHKAVMLIDRNKAIVSAVVTVEPIAGLVWGGTMAVIPYLNNIFQQDVDATEGYESICLRLIESTMMEENLRGSYSRPSTSENRKKLISTIQDNLALLYFEVLRYHVRLFFQYSTQYSRHAINRFLRNLVAADEWKSMAQGVDGAMHNILAQMHLLADNEAGLAYDTDSDDMRDLNQLDYIFEAFHDSKDVSNAGSCLSGTRMDTLKAIKDWIEDPDGEPMFRLTGLAGTGKSTVSITAANALSRGSWPDGYSLANTAVLGATFFFSAKKASRNSGRHFFVSVAWWLGHTVPGLRDEIARAARDNPQLIEASELLFPLDFILVIDALDECGVEDAKGILQELKKLTRLGQVRLRVLLTSRSGTSVDGALGDTQQAPRYLSLEKIRLCASNDGPQVGVDDTDDDIVRFLWHMLSDIAMRRGFPHDWLDRKKVVELSKMTGGLFIYASVVCRFFDHDYFDNEVLDSRLRQILSRDKESETPERTLIDDIYTKVLRFHYDTQPRKERAAASLRIKTLLGTIAVLCEPVTIVTLATLLRKPHELLRTQLAPFGPVLNIPEMNDAGHPLDFVHLSFGDFLLSHECPKEFSVDITARHFAILDWCLNTMSNQLHQDQFQLRMPGSLLSGVATSLPESSLPESLRYACCYWIDHLEKIDSETRQGFLTDQGRIHSFLKKNLLFWLEALSLISRISISIPVLNKLLYHVNPSKSPNLYGLLEDALPFIRRNQSIAEKAPLQLYCSGLVFWPRENAVYKEFSHLIPIWIKQPKATVQQGVQRSSDANLFVFEGQEGDIYGVAYSLDNTAIAARSSDGVTVWDAISGMKKSTISTRNAMSFALSNDAKKLLIGSIDEIAVWDLETNQKIRVETEDYIVALEFSPQGDIVASGSADGTIRLWDIWKGDEIRTFKSSSQLVRYLRFSLDGKVLASAAGSSPTGGPWSLELWDLRDDSLTMTLQESCRHIMDMRLSADGNQMTFVPESGDIKVKARGRSDSCLPLHRDERITTIALSPTDFGMVAIGYIDGTIKLHQAGTPKDIGYLRGHQKSITSLSFTSDGRALASASKDRTVRLWEVGITSSDEHKQPTARIARATFFPASENMVEVTMRDMTRRPGHERLFTTIWDWDLGGQNIGQTREDALDISEHQILRESGPSWDVEKLEVSPKGDLILVCFRNGKAQFWNASTKRAISELFDDVTEARFSADGKVVALISKSYDITVLKVQSWEPLAAFKNPLILDCTLSPDGQTIAWVTFKKAEPMDFELKVYDLVRSSQRFCSSCGMDSLIQRLIFSPDGESLLHMRDAEPMRILDVPTGEERGQFGHPPSPQTRPRQFFTDDRRSHIRELDEDVHEDFETPSFSPDGMYVAYSEDNRLKIWDTRTMSQVEPPDRGITHRLSGLAFSQGGLIAISCPKYDSSETVVKVWDLVKKVEKAVFRFSAPLSLLRISDDAKFIESSCGRRPCDAVYQDRHWSSLEMMPSDLQDHLYVESEWIVQGFGNLVWLPPPFRNSASAVKGGKVALFNQFGAVEKLEFLLTDTPLVKGKNFCHY
ncbi:WD40-repeat-containing domain protein [Ilyonectria robusta]|uniref:WD40-repeat-containing domain protein n=1 Tax=Ilyonectria robusta TaxID=1079257 RepID=UPI001E8D526A|nr:WD40-repeat-containing domain protein [Ilyonectria robusta]KAH8663787.1 WD40-repeat-containing domain protein [Ilyonectria robusta]